MEPKSNTEPCNSPAPLVSPIAGVVALLMTWLSYQRYQQQHWKMTELSYGTAVILHATESSAKEAAPPAPQDSAVQDD